MAFFQKNFISRIRTLFSVQKNQTEIIEGLEEILLTADAGINVTQKFLSLLSEQRPKTVEEAITLLKIQIQNDLTPSSNFKVTVQTKPLVIYLVGVNGVGKTTTIGKLACQFKEQGHQVMMIAADTFRAAAVAQLKIWSEKNDVLFHAGQEQADPSSVIVDGLRSAQAKGTDLVLIDTAGRLHTKTNLMQELQKMTRMCEKVLNKPADEIFLVIDAITGQNGFAQAKVFLEAVPVTGIILTKYDATAKGGIIFSIVQETGLPIRYVGFGEKIHDLKKFDANEFVERMFS